MVRMRHPCAASKRSELGLDSQVRPMDSQVSPAARRVSPSPSCLRERIVSPEQYDFPRASQKLSDTLRRSLVVGDVHVEDVGPGARSRGPRLDSGEVDAVLFEDAQDLEQETRTVGVGLDEERSLGPFEVAG